MPHHCQALVFRCMDFRLKPTILAELLAQAGYAEGDYDLVSAAGAGKDLLSAKPGEADFLLKQIELSQKLHGITEVVMLYHDNCGAYGIADAGEERGAETADLEKIKNFIGSKFPDLKISTFIVSGTPTEALGLEKI